MPAFILTPFVKAEKEHRKVIDLVRTKNILSLYFAPVQGRSNMSVDEQP